MKTRSVALASLLLLAPLDASASWRVLRPPDGESATTPTVAVAVNPEGYSLTVQPLPAGGGARCALALPAAGGSIAAEALPTLEVDARPAQQVARWQPSDAWEDGGDFVEALRREMRWVPLVELGTDRVVFDCWLALPGQQSPTRGVLRDLLDGRELLVRFGLSGGEHRETTFSLAGAREVLGEALEIPVEPDRGDLLQDELLAFRVDYRKTTCYLLGGAKAEKRRERCLEAVEECRARNPESVLSMLGCIEGE